MFDKKENKTQHMKNETDWLWDLPLISKWWEQILMQEKKVITIHLILLDVTFLAAMSTDNNNDDDDNDDEEDVNNNRQSMIARPHLTFLKWAKKGKIFVTCSVLYCS